MVHLLDAYLRHALPVLGRWLVCGSHLVHRALGLLQTVHSLIAYFGLLLVQTVHWLLHVRVLGRVGRLLHICVVLEWIGWLLDWLVGRGRSGLLLASRNSQAFISN